MKADKIMRVTRRLLPFVGLVGMLMLTLAQPFSYGQTREEFRDIEEGFKVARAIEKDGQHSLIIVYPDKYLTDEKAYIEGSLKMLPLVFGCELFKDCKPLALGTGVTVDGNIYVYFDVENDKSLRIALFRLTQDGKQPVGAVLLLVPRTAVKEETPRIKT